MGHQARRRGACFDLKYRPCFKRRRLNALVRFSAVKYLPLQTATKVWTISLGCDHKNVKWSFLETNCTGSSIHIYLLQNQVGKSRKIERSDLQSSQGWWAQFKNKQNYHSMHGWKSNIFTSRIKNVVGRLINLTAGASGAAAETLF